VVGLQGTSHSIDDHDPLRVLTGQPTHPVRGAVNECDPTISAAHLDRDRPAGRQSVRAEVRVRSHHPLDATASTVEHKSS
jgi:hypothetical protein